MKRTNFLKKELASFRQWKGESYAAFSSLHRVIRIASLAAIYFTFLGYKQTFAQTDTSSVDRKINLNEVKVSARRTPSLYSQIGRVVTVISRKEIENLPVQSLPDLLKYALNIDVRQRGPLGIQADVSVRGGSFDQVMVLLNGINITDPQTGHLSLNLPVDIESIERVEILEGPGAQVYGPSAFSGAINFVTGTRKNDNVTARVMGGDHGLFNAGGNGTFTTGKVKSYAAVNYGKSDGYISNTDFNILNLFYQGQFSFDNEKLELQAGHTDKSFGANAFYTPKYPNQYEQNRITFASLKMTSGKTVKFTPAIYWRRHQDRFELFREEAPSWYTKHNHHLTDVFGGNINMVIPWQYGKTAVGGEVRSENIWSNNIGNDMNTPLPVPGEDAQFTKFYNRANASVFLEHSYTYERLSLSAGVLMNWNSGIDYKFKFFPGIDISYWLSDQVKTFASVNKSLRMPTFTDLFYTGPTNIGNPDLKPEEALTYEGGVKIINRGFKAHVSAFFRQSDNLIDWGKAAGEEKYVTRNLSEMESWGLETSLELNLQQLLAPDFFVRHIDVGYAFIDQDKQAIDGYESVYVLDYLKHKVSLGLQHKLVAKLEANWNFLYQDRNGQYMAYLPDGDGFKEVPTDYDPFITTDLRVMWRDKYFNIYVDANNLFDVSYNDLGNVPQPGRWIKAGIQVSLDF